MSGETGSAADIVGVWMPPVSAHETMTFLVGPAIATAIVPYCSGASAVVIGRENADFRTADETRCRMPSVFVDGIAEFLESARRIPHARTFDFAATVAHS
jgi:hypothetical protein